MERGEFSVALAVVSVIAFVGILATASLIFATPTADIVQGGQVYPTVSQDNLPIACNGAKQVIYLGTLSYYGVYCCPEDMHGQNECINPHYMLTT